MRTRSLVTKAVVFPGKFRFRYLSASGQILSKATRNTTYISARRGSARRRASSANDFVLDPTFTGSFQARTICVGQCTSYFLFRASMKAVFRASREAHSCSELCAAPGICKIETSPQAIEATFTGKQYTKVSTDIILLRISVLKRFP